MFKNKKNLYTLVSSIGVIIIGLVIFLGYKAYTNNQTQIGAKNITVKVIIDNEVNKEYKFNTDAKFLGPALDEQNLISTESFSGGRYVTAIGDYASDDTKQQWWLIKVNDVGATVGIDDLTIKNGDVITFELQTGY